MIGRLACSPASLPAYLTSEMASEVTRAFACAAVYVLAAVLLAKVREVLAPRGIRRASHRFFGRAALPTAAACWC